MIRGMKLAGMVGVIVMTSSLAQAGHGHYGHKHGHHHGHYHHGYHGPRFGLMIAPAVVAPPPMVAATPVYPYPVPAYAYPAYVPPPIPVYAPAPVGLGFQTRNFSLFFGR